MKKNNILILKPRYISVLSLSSAFLTCYFPVPQLTFGLLLKGQERSSNVDVLLLRFLLEGQKELHEEVKDAVSGLRKFLATESPLKMMRNAFYFASKALFLLKIFRFLS